MAEVEIESIYTFEKDGSQGVVVARKLDSSVKIEGGATLAGAHVLSIDEQGTKVEFRLTDARDAVRFTPGQRVLVEA